MEESCREDLTLEDSIVKEGYTPTDVTEDNLLSWFREACLSPTASDSEEDSSDEERLFECRFCPIQFKSKDTLYGHSRVHVGCIKQHTCTVCSKFLGNTVQLVKHLQKHKMDKEEEDVATEMSPTSSRMLPCELCGKKFAKLAHLMNHLINHFKQKHMLLCYCQVCQRPFRCKNSASKHVIGKHLGQEDLSKLASSVVKKLSDLADEYIKDISYECKCVYCANAFNNEYDLTVHKRTFHRGLPERIEDGPVSAKMCSVVIEKWPPEQKSTARNLRKKKKKNYKDVKRHAKCLYKLKSKLCSCEKNRPDPTKCSKTVNSQPRQVKIVRCFRHNVHEDGFTCPICGRKFEEQKNVVDHVLHFHTKGEAPRGRSRTLITQILKEPVEEVSGHRMIQETPIMGGSGARQSTVQFLEVPMIIVEDSTFGNYSMPNTTWQEVMTVNEESLMIEDEITIKEEEITIEDEVLAPTSQILVIPDENSKENSVSDAAVKSESDQETGATKFYTSCNSFSGV
ncbi:zinc finger protein 91-like [Lutzomyia longipalpis]|uniref:zinc finger protein 91-like n=1 Tax=Lutzomyia longipalpis TaxID=7200 RepID=UPI002484448E|nr:zinc finger protein 91-like [Lutzomyia longipalpis]